MALFNILIPLQQCMLSTLVARVAVHQHNQISRQGSANKDLSRDDLD